jgi:DNA-binding NtrC family response regulator
MQSEQDQCIAAGMDDFIAKPVDIEQMLDTISRHWRNSRRLGAIRRMRTAAPGWIKWHHTSFTQEPSMSKLDTRRFLPPPCQPMPPT